jgi:serine/threonine protein kinase
MEIGENEPTLSAPPYLYLHLHSFLKLLPHCSPCRVISRSSSPQVYPLAPLVLHEVEEVTQVDAEGTPGYLPPEILLSGVSPGWTVDYWSLGCVLYFCLFGRPKYYGSDFQQACCLPPPLLITLRS